MLMIHKFKIFTKLNIEKKQRGLNLNLHKNVKLLKTFMLKLIDPLNRFDSLELILFVEPLLLKSSADAEMLKT